ncbi:MAG: hypothetical protein ACTSU5_10490 [Promethearchaeota archaeon]
MRRDLSSNGLSSLPETLTRLGSLSLLVVDTWLRRDGFSWVYAQGNNPPPVTCTCPRSSPGSAGGTHP